MVFVHLFILTASLLSASTIAQACDPGWFGSSCQYKCHCSGNQCDTEGQCTNGAACEKGWFGPSCQYVDLTQNGTVTSNPTTSDVWVLADGDNTTCLNDSTLESVTVTWDTSYPFTWLRLLVNNKDALHNITVQFSNGTSPSTVDCTDRQNAAISDTALDIHCDLIVTISQVILTGEGIKVLCSLYISGGRNVALEQNATQTSTHGIWTADKAVDGRAGKGTQAEFCTHTNGTDPSRPSWTVKLTGEHSINRYVLYNRIGCCPERLQGFVLTSFDPNGGIVFSYTDMSSVSLVYNVTSVIDTQPVASVRVNATKIVAKRRVPILTLCEVELYGDSVCKSGKYGRECEKDCNCAVQSEACLVSTGGCPSGCSAGFYGEACQTECPPTRYGISCREKCSINCTDQLCNSGNCQRCVPGKTGDQCEKDCPDGTYGQDCNETCSEHCVAGAMCNPVNGSCLQGCEPGYITPQCNTSCANGTYGQDCNETCSEHCVGGAMCSPVNGSCPNGCEPGYTLAQCNTNCPKGRYGQDCNKTCSEHCVGGAMCSPVNGSCLHGCESGYTSSHCDIKCPNKTYGPDCNMTCSANCKVNETAAPALCDYVTATDDSDGTELIIGLVMAAVVVLLLAVILAVIFWRRRKRHSTPKNQSNMETPMDKIEPVFSQPERAASLQNSIHNTVDDAGDGTADDVPDTAETPATSATGGYYNTHTVCAGQKMTAIRIEDLGAFLSSHDKDFYRKQFEKVPGVIERFTMDVGLSDENKCKNRYKNICAYDHSRVHLKINRNRHEGDYINASYVEGYNNEEKYIASQAPNQLMLDDFIRMLWEQKPDKVVMLTNLIEEGKARCEQYWPDDGEMVVGGITIELQTTHVFADYTIRKLCLSKKKASHNLTQFHFTSWPDKGVPDTPWPLVDFEQRVASYPTTKAIIVHCSAGVGRTGTFIALHHVMREAEDKGTMDFYSTLEKLRNARMNMIQTLDQYIFLHSAAHVAMICQGTTVTASKSTDRLEKLQTLSSTGQSNMESEFEAVRSACSVDIIPFLGQSTGSNDVTENDYENSRTADNKLKNRVNNILPNENYRAVLTRELKDVGDYINAVVVPSFTKRDDQILTQLPMPGTVLDFWRLVMQYQITVIVAFEADSRDTDETIGEYLPASENDVLTSGPFDIKTESITSASLWDKQKLVISTNDQYSSMSVTSCIVYRELQIHHLKCTCTSTDAKNLLSIVGQIRSLRSSSQGRTLYMCRNGANYSGLICVLTLLLDRLDNDHCLTVPLVVGTVKCIRPQVIPAMDQYKALYGVLQRYVETRSDYTNFGEHNFVVNQQSTAEATEPDDQSYEESDDEAKVYANVDRN